MPTMSVTIRRRQDLRIAAATLIGLSVAGAVVAHWVGLL